MSRKRKTSTKATSGKQAPVEERLTIQASLERMPLTLVLRIAGALFLLLSLIGMVQPEWRLWGFSHTAFLPRPIGIALLLAGALMLTPLGAKFIAQIMPRLALLRNRSAWLWAAAAFALFFGLRVSVPLLGDSQLWIRELTWIGEFEAQGSEVPMGRILKRKEPLSLAVHEAVFSLASTMSPVSAQVVAGQNAQEQREARLNHFRDLARDVYVWMSIAAGALTVLMLVSFARRRLPPAGRAPFFLLWFSGGGMLLFFGYIENYSWTSLWMIACLLAGIEESLPPRRFPWKTLAAFVLAVGFHYSAIVLLPGVLYLLVALHIQSADRRSGDVHAPTKRARWVAAGFLIAGAAGYVWVKGWEGWISIIPLLPQWSKDGYCFVSPAHWVDLINLFALAAMAACAVFFALRSARESSLEERTADGFLLLTAGSGALFAVLFNPNLGMGRDWDLYGAVLWPLAIAAAWRIAHVKPVNRAALLSTLIGFVLLVSLPSVLVNRMYEPSITRFRSLLALDRSRAAYGVEIALHYQRRGEIEERVECWRQAIEIERNPRYVFNYADALKLSGKLVEAEPFYVEAALATRDSETKIYREQLLYVAMGLIGVERFDRARHVIEVAGEIMPDNKDVARLKGMLDDAERVSGLIAARDYDGALRETLAARERDPKNSYWGKMLERIRARRGEGEE